MSNRGPLGSISFLSSKESISVVKAIEHEGILPTNLLPDGYDSNSTWMPHRRIAVRCDSSKEACKFLGCAAAARSRAWKATWKAATDCGKSLVASCYY